MSGEIREITDGTFTDEVEKASGVVVVDIGAAWCGPCHAVEPAVKELAREYAGRVKVTKLDYDGNPETALRFGIRSIPTFLFFRNGEVVDRVVGALPKPLLERRFAAAVAAA